MAASSPTKKDFTILFVHGGYHSPVFFEPIIQLLQQKGYAALCPHLPTCNPAILRESPDIDMKADAQAIENELRRLVVQEGRRVLVAMFSYGGIPGTEAVAEDLSRKHRKARDEEGGVVGLMYVSAFLLQEGKALEDRNAGKPRPWIDTFVSLWLFFIILPLPPSPKLIIMRIPNPNQEIST